MLGFDIRPESPGDIEAIRALNRAAFEGEAEAELVDRLRQCDAFIPALSLVAVTKERLVGHLLLTHAAVTAADGDVPALALAPMAVAADRQRRGIGSRLVLRALADAAQLGHRLVIVVGHPTYYPRFGFVPASRYRIRAPFDAPDEVVMALWLDETASRTVDGAIRYAPPFQALESA